MQAPNDHDHERLEEESVRVEARPASWSGTGGTGRGRETVDQANQLDKERVLGDHRRASEGSVHGHTPCSGAFQSQSSRSSRCPQIFMTRPQLTVRMPVPDWVDPYLMVDAVAKTVQPSYVVSTGGNPGPLTKRGDPLPIPASWVDSSKAMAVGIVSTSSEPETLLCWLY